MNLMGDNMDRDSLIDLVSKGIKIEYNYKKDKESWVAESRLYKLVLEWSKEVKYYSECVNGRKEFDNPEEAVNHYIEKTFNKDNLFYRFDDALEYVIKNNLIEGSIEIEYDEHYEIVDGIRRQIISNIITV
jgi:hypothetical protein